MTGVENSKKRSVLDDLFELELPEGQFMVMGSGIMDVLGIRRAKDVDLVVSPPLYAELTSAGWSNRVASNGSAGIENGVFQAYDHWTDEDAVKTLEELLIDAQWVDGVAYNSLAKLIAYKARRGLAKDFADILLIEEYKASPNHLPLS